MIANQRAEFMGLHIDPDKVRMENAKKQGPDVKRKNGCVVNSGSVYCQTICKCIYVAMCIHAQDQANLHISLSSPNDIAIYTSLFRTKVVAIALYGTLKTEDEQLSAST